MSHGFGLRDLARAARIDPEYTSWRGEPTASSDESLLLALRALAPDLGIAIERLGLSARAYHRVLKVARTCADLAGVADIRRVHVSEAISLRALDRSATC